LRVSFVCGFFIQSLCGSKQQFADSVERVILVPAVSRLFNLHSSADVIEGFIGEFDHMKWISYSDDVAEHLLEHSPISWALRVFPGCIGSESTKVTGVVDTILV
jgi:hypothetical protein